MKVIQFPNKKGLSREEFKHNCKDIIDRLEGDFSLIFSNQEDIFYEPPKADIVILTTSEEEHHKMQSCMKSKHYYMPREE